MDKMYKIYTNNKLKDEIEDIVNNCTYVSFNDDDEPKHELMFPNIEIIPTEGISDISRIAIVITNDYDDYTDLKNILTINCISVVDLCILISMKNSDNETREEAYNIQKIIHNHIGKYGVEVNRKVNFKRAKYNNITIDYSFDIAEILSTVDFYRYDESYKISKEE